VLLSLALLVPSHPAVAQPPSAAAGEVTENGKPSEASKADPKEGAGDADEAPAEETLSNLPPTDPDYDFRAEQERFEATMHEWRELLVDLHREMILFHNSSDPAKSSTHRENYRQLEVRGWMYYDRAFRSALELVRHAPRESYAAAQFLVLAVNDRYATDLYEMTGEGAEQLLRIQADMDRLAEIAAVSYVAVGQFDKAEPFMTEALQSTELKPEDRLVLMEYNALRELWQQEREQREVDAQRDDLPRVRLRTNRGTMVLELFEDQAPNTVANFIYMVERGELDNLPFYQVLPGQVAMVGDSTDASTGYCIPDEHTRENRRHIFRGSLVMAKLPDTESEDRMAVPNSGGRQFFIAMKPLPVHDREHTVFGRIIEGMHVLSAVNRVNPLEEDEDKPQPDPDVVVDAEVIRKRRAEYRPQIIDMPPLEMVRRNGEIPPGALQAAPAPEASNR
jgi:peptidylprolyl isomerase